LLTNKKNKDTDAKQTNINNDIKFKKEPKKRISDKQYKKNREK
jgi:hypothetical protein